MRERIVLVTGSSKGIGAAVAQRFATSRDKVVVTYLRDAESAQNIARECQRLGAKEVLVLPLDVTDLKSVESLAARVIEKFGRIDILVNNAGVTVAKNLAEQTDGEIEKQINTNLFGVIRVTKACLPNITQTIINIGSSLALRGKKRLTAYSATKFGVRGFTRSLAAERPDLRVLTVNPSLTATGTEKTAGAPPSEVAEIVWRAANGGYRVVNGGDVNVNYYRANLLKRGYYKIKDFLDFLQGRL